MTNIINIANFFNNIDINDMNKLVLLLELMYKDGLLNTELLLNLIKALVLIFHLDNNNFDIYYNIFYYLYYDMNKKLCNILFDKMKEIKLESQVYLHDIQIENIIIAINNYIIDNHIMAKLEEKIIQLINTTIILQRLNQYISLNYRVKLYIYVLKNHITNNDLRKIIYYINAY